MTVAENDVLTPVGLALDAYAKAKEPKQLNILRGAGHFESCRSLSDTTGRCGRCDTENPLNSFVLRMSLADTGKWFKQNSDTQAAFFKKALFDE